MKSVTANDIDNLGILLAQIADLTKQADEIKSRLKESGDDCKEGFLYNAVVVRQERTTYDPRKVELLLGAHIKLVERTSESVSVRVTARKAA